MRSLAETKEPGTRPMCPGDPLGNHGQRPIALAVVFEPLLAHEDGMGVTAPLAHQGRAGLQHSAGVERTNAFVELVRQNPNAALQSAARAAMGAQLQLIGEVSDDQIATEPQGRSGVIKYPPDTSQFLCRLTGQPGDFAIKLSQVRIPRSVFSAIVGGETRGRLARVLASRSVVEGGFHRFAESAMR